MRRRSKTIRPAVACHTTAVACHATAVEDHATNDRLVNVRGYSALATRSPRHRAGRTLHTPEWMFEKVRAAGIRVQS